jgi:hypothetical protein
MHTVLDLCVIRCIHPTCSDSLANDPIIIDQEISLMNANKRAEDCLGDEILFAVQI